MKQTAIINIVGLSQRILGKHTPFLSQWSKKKNLGVIESVLPAVTCSVQSTYLTGKWPGDHGIVGNGWYFRDEHEVKLWRQSNKLVQGEKVWDKAKKLNPKFTCANMFWWYNMYSSVDFSVTPRPQYLADGRKIPDCYSYPSDLRVRLQDKLGTFPLFNFWGPMANIKSSNWIAEASKLVHEWTNPTLMLVYLPHLDYTLQKHGHNEKLIKKDLQEIDAVAKDLITNLEAKGVNVTILSEYGITDVSKPIHINRILREMKLIHLREERGLELLDAGNSAAFALADHQIAHVYIKDKTQIQIIKKKLENIPGIEMVLDKQTKKEHNLDHSRAGELVIIADQESWFTYYYWLDDKKAPDFARNVDIHNKPGYDPVEMFLDPAKKFIMPRIALKLLKKKLGFRSMMNVIPLDATLVKGSHGRIDVADEDRAIFIGNDHVQKNIDPTQISDYILNQIFE